MLLRAATKPRREGLEPQQADTKVMQDSVCDVVARNRNTYLYLCLWAALKGEDDPTYHPEAMKLNQHVTGSFANVQQRHRA